MTGRIFIVDDNAANLSLLARILRDAGHDVRMANHPRRALAAIRAAQPDIVMLDITMPEIDGYEVCAALKADPALRDAAVIFISALDDVVDKVRAFDIGGVDYVTKPFEAGEVLARVATQLRLARLTAELTRKNRELEERRRALDDDLEQADAFQRALLEAPARWRGVDIAVLYRPAEKVGGDCYDVHETADGRLRVLLVDATGHGIQASLRTMIVKAVYERRRRAVLSPSEVLAALNDDLVALRPDLSLRSAAACLDLDEHGAVRYANAGLLPVKLARGGQFFEDPHTGPFIGMVAGARYQHRHLHLDAGTRLFVYTDGLVEDWQARGAAPRPGTPVERVDDEAARFAALASGDNAAAGIAALDVALGGADAVLSDDVTVIALASTA